MLGCYCCLLVCWVDLEGFFCVVLDVSLYILMYCIEGFSWGVLGITHLWIGKKWPCGGRALVGPQ